MSSASTIYHAIPEAPGSVSAGTILGRLVDGIGFRFHWATEGLREADLTFRPAPDCMSLAELMEHVLELLAWVAVSVGLPKPAAAGPVRARVLELAGALGARLKEMPDAEVAACSIRTSRGESRPVWNIVNGPLADSLTHIGQILSWRRISGRPAAQADVFRGQPPKG